MRNGIQKYAGRTMGPVESSSDVSLSIIVPMLNEARALPALLPDLTRLRREDCEVLFVDGGSDDASVAIAERAGFTVLQSSHGRARQMNAGARAARGKLLLFLHADTRLPADAAARLRRFLAEDLRAWGFFAVRIQGESRMLRVVSSLMKLRSRLSGIATGDQALFVHRVVFGWVGGFPDQPLMEDVELSRRLKRITRPTCLSEKITTSGRRWEASGVLADHFVDVVSAARLLARSIARVAGEGLPMKSLRTVIFAKALRPGHVKTRLIPALRVQGATALARRLLEHVISEVMRAQIGAVELCATPADEEAWRDIDIPASVERTDQGPGDLGARLARASERVIGTGSAVLLIGTDCPALDGGVYLRRSRGELAGGRCRYGTCRGRGLCRVGVESIRSSPVF